MNHLSSQVCKSDSSDDDEDGDGSEKYNSQVSNNSKEAVDHSNSSVCKNSYIDEEPPRKRGRPWKAESSPKQSLSSNDSCNMQLPVSNNEVNKTSISEPVVSSDVHSSDKTHQDDSSLSADSKISDINCPFCSKVFNTADGLVNHVNFKCKMNTDDSSSSSNLTSTHRICPPSKSSKTFGSLKVSSYSSKRSDDESVKHEQVASYQRSKFKCACGKVYDFHRSLQHHIDSKTISYTCPHCSKVFSTSQGFKNHLSTRVCRKYTCDDSVSDKDDDVNDEDGDHDDDDDDDDDDDVHKRVEYIDVDKFKCACGRVYQNEKKFLNHVRYGTLKFPCANCAREFTTQHSLEQHIFDDKCKGL